MYNMSGFSPVMGLFLLFFVRCLMDICAQPEYLCSPALWHCEVKTYTVQKPMMGMTASLSADDKAPLPICMCLCTACPAQDSVHYIYVCVKGEARHPAPACVCLQIPVRGCQRWLTDHTSGHSLVWLLEDFCAFQLCGARKCSPQDPGKSLKPTVELMCRQQKRGRCND